ncbi:hypothetical protein [Actinoplanes missouriensis]|uniref:hypothetical protein n=1 Tax=Actinoplanes missouriensis TaxID=1866 RepID=UPI0006B06CDD|nr:hypothetical protein ADL19_23325 [Streptomyces purpurogeneiscleroticus]
MVDSTPIYGLPYQEDDDPPNGPLLSQSLAEAAEAAIRDVGRVVGYYSNTGTVQTVTTAGQTICTAATALRPGWAYDVTVRSQVSTSAALDFLPQIRRPDSSILVDYGRQGLPATGDRFYEFRCSFRTAPTFTAATVGIVFRGTVSAGTAAFKGFASGPFEMVVRQAGAYDDCPGAPTY